jgi:hypothetical protein
MLAEYLLTISSYETIGKVVGRSRETAKLSIRRLLDAGYFDRRIADGRLVLFPNNLGEAPGKTRDKASGKTAGNANFRSPHLTEVCSPNCVASEDSAAIPSYRRPRAARPPATDSLAGSEQETGASLSTSDDLPSSAASTSKAAIERAELSASTTPSAQSAPPSHAAGRAVQAAELLADSPGVRGAPYELPDDFVFDRGWPRSLGADDARIDLEIDKFRNWAVANGELSASWRLVWRNWWLSQYQDIPIRDQARALEQLRCRAGGVENADCFWLVRHHYGESKIGLVKIALATYGPDETWNRTIDAIETGNDIGHALWVPDHLRG